MKDKVYLVQYSGGGYTDFYKVVIFATEDENTAIKYVEKFNTLLQKCITYYKKFEDEHGWFDSEKFNNAMVCKWYMLREIHKCYYEQIEVR